MQVRILSIQFLQFPLPASRSTSGPSFAAFGYFAAATLQDRGTLDDLACSPITALN
jgi:hypothetical protein